MPEQGAAAADAEHGLPAMEAAVEAGPAAPEELKESLASVGGAEAPKSDDPQYSMENVFNFVCGKLYDAPIQEREERREHLLRCRFRLPLNRVKVAPSSKHGLGVFATRSIAADELVTMYPGDALRFYPATPDGAVGSERSGVMFGHHLPESMRDGEAVMSKYRPFTYDVDGMYAIVGLPDLIEDPAYAGHMVNDATTCSMDPADRERYRKTSAGECNATFEGLLDAAVAVVASRPIAEGEEVLVAYGPEYWTSLEKLRGVCSDLETRAKEANREGGKDKKRRRTDGEEAPSAAA